MRTRLQTRAPLSTPPSTLAVWRVQRRVIAVRSLLRSQAPPALAASTPSVRVICPQRLVAASESVEAAEAAHMCMRCEMRAACMCVSVRVCGAGSGGRPRAARPSGVPSPGPADRTSRCPAPGRTAACGPACRVSEYVRRCGISPKIGTILIERQASYAQHGRGSSGPAGRR